MIIFTFLPAVLVLPQIIIHHDFTAATILITSHTKRQKLLHGTLSTQEMPLARLLAFSVPDFLSSKTETALALIYNMAGIVL